jgi:enterochelin esterase-like enzyme
MRRALIAVAVLFIVVGVIDLVRSSKGTAYHSTAGATLVHFTLHSRATHRDLHEILVRPRGGRGRFLLVLLHGRGADPASWLSQPFFDELHALGTRAPAVLLLDGGDHSYWHDRRDGAWGTMVLREAIPAGVARTHATAVAIGGMSMGGFGALDLARTTGRFCAVGAHSPALWETASETAPGAFDDAADYARHDLFTRPPLYRAPVWIDVGTNDPFRTADTAFARKLQSRVTFHVWPGGHDEAYWRSHVAQYLRFYAGACG